MRSLRPRPRSLLTYGLAVALLIPLGTEAQAQASSTLDRTFVAIQHPSPRPLPRATSLIPAVAAQPTLTTVVQASGFDQLQADVDAIAVQSGAQVGISLQELSGRGRQTLTLNGTQGFYAASEYKLPLLMAEAQQIAAGQLSVNDSLCYDPTDAEDGWFTDYQPGACFSRGELASRTGQFSDNTAARILVRYLGGPDALNAFAHGAGMSNSALWDPNTTTANDLVAAWVREAMGQLGGASAEAWLYPLLMHTAAESGIPAGLPSAATVVHKTGDMYGVQLDAGYIRNGSVQYVLAVCVSGLDETTGWNLIQRISARVWQYEASRPDYLAPVTATPAPKLRDPRH